ncbi:hypothetical protein RR46_09863 [Papilio xuthus]|uniref:Uncharacterized protein n=1 Tax=Papilio xuthus TaxID=66420 RepID=A0A194QCF0_PAPXU|nr:hypothetical protein RR46_09863 [Papilio xuthus]
MENPTVAGLRSRSRSKTPFLRSSCDREHCMEGEDHTHHKSGRKTPVKRSTPIKQFAKSSNKDGVEVIEEDQENESVQAHRTRQSSRLAEKLIKTSDYSSEESLDRLKGHRKEIVQNEINSQYERVSTSSKRYGNFEDLPYSPIHASHNVTQDRSTRYSSPAYSACSTDSSFAEQALADASVLLEREPSCDHLPSRLYKMAGEYWNKYPKTDYTYSPLSRDRVELAPGQVAMPNMSRKSLAQFRMESPPGEGSDVPDRMPSIAAWTATATRKRFTTIESSDDEGAYMQKTAHSAEERWWFTQLLVAMMTSITSTTRNTYRKIFGPPHRYPYTDRRPAKASIASRTGSALITPFYWVYLMMKTVVTTTVTTITETITSKHEEKNGKYIARGYQSTAAKRRAWPWLLLLLPFVGYGLNYTYKNYEHLAMPNFTNLQIDLSEFYAMEIPKISLPTIPNISLSDFYSLPRINLTLPDINLTLPEMPNVGENLPRVSKAYREYKDIVQNRMADATDYISVVAGSCYEEIRRFWAGFWG